MEDSPKIILYIIFIVVYIIYQVYKSIKKSGDTNPPKDITAPGSPDFDIEEMIKEMRRMTGGGKKSESAEPPRKPQPPVEKPGTSGPRSPMGPRKPSVPMPEATHYKYAKEGMRPERMVREAPVLFSQGTKARSQERTDQKERIRMERTMVDVVDYDEQLIQKGRMKNRGGEVSDIHFSFAQPKELFHDKIDLRQAVIMSEILRRPDY